MFLVRMITMIMWTNERRDTSLTCTRHLYAYRVDPKVGTLEDSDRSSLMVQFNEWVPKMEPICDYMHLLV